MFLKSCSRMSNIAFPCVNPIQLAPNFIFDIFEPQTFQRYSICWVFQAFSVQLFYIYFATRPSTAFTAAVIYIIYFSGTNYFRYRYVFPGSVPVLFSGTTMANFFRYWYFLRYRYWYHQKTEQNSRYHSADVQSSVRAGAREA